MRGFLSISVLAALGTLSCDPNELCIGSPPPRCEGNVRAYCPGGWGTLDITRDREDCRSRNQYCGTSEDPIYPGADCMHSFGTCTENPSTPRCVGGERGGSVGCLLRCQNGQLLGVGEHCDLPDAGESPSPDAGQSPSKSPG